MQIKLRRVLALSLLGSLFLSTVYILGWSNFFDVEKIEIKTSDESNRTLIANRLTDSDLELEIGDPMARVNVRAISNLLQEDQWIGRVEVDLKWFAGLVSIRVSERSPVMVVERSVKSLGQSQTTKEFIDEQGAIFNLPGDLGSKYREVPLLRLESDDLEARLSALRLLKAINPVLPTREMTATPIATFISESEVGALAGQDRGNRWLEIKWGSGEEIELKLAVVTQLLDLKANRAVNSIDVSNPSLPIVK